MARRHAPRNLPGPISRRAWPAAVNTYAPAAQTIATEATGPLRTWAADLDRAFRAEWGAETDSRPSYPALGGA